MRWDRVIVYGVLGTGAAGYLVAGAMAVHLRWWLGRAVPEWPRLLLRTLLFCLGGLGLLFGISLGTELRVLGGVARGVLNLVAAVFLAVVPWTMAGALHRWRREVERRARRGID